MAKVTTKKAPEVMDDERGRVNVSISRRAYKRLQEFAKQQKYEVPLSKIVEAALAQHFGDEVGR